MLGLLMSNTKQCSLLKPNGWSYLKLLTYRTLVLLFLGLSSPLLHADEAVVPTDGVGKEINLIISAKQQPLLTRANFINRAEDMDSLYKLANYQLLWLGKGHAEKNITDALTLLSNAETEGLTPASYDVAILQQKLKATLALSSDAYKELAAYDTALSLSVLRYLHDLHYGRVDAQSIGYNLKLRQNKLLNLPVLIKDSLAQGTISQLSSAAEPKLKQYQKLKQALANYRTLATKTNALALVVDKSVAPGSSFAQSAELKQFLVSLGDMPEDNSKPDGIYNSKIAAGVKKFQLRHGLNSDGVLGAGTVANLNTPVKDRITQIELAMERLRWLPEPSAGRSLIVNIPAFQLWAFDDIDEFNADIPNMRVVVGKAMETQTPVLMAKMSFIDFMPYWNVPNKITKEEILPKLMKNSRYLDKENMELVSSFGNTVKAVPFGSDSINKIKQGLLKVRQRPGKKNALGKVKFIFPNKDDVYLHDTPAHSLFSKSRRDFSHGCVRVANPEKLAEFALKNQWTTETIQKALTTPKTQRVILKKSIPVLFFYVTAYIDKNENLTFYSDIYGHDAALLAALKNPEDLADSAIFAPPPAPVVPTTGDSINSEEATPPIEDLTDNPAAIKKAQPVAKPAVNGSATQPVIKPEQAPAGTAPKTDDPR